MSALFLNQLGISVNKMDSMNEKYFRVNEAVNICIIIIFVILVIGIVRSFVRSSLIRSFIRSFVLRSFVLRSLVRSFFFRSCVFFISLTISTVPKQVAF